MARPELWTSCASVPRGPDRTSDESTEQLAAATRRGVDQTRALEGVGAHCQGRSFDAYRRRVQPCERPRVARVMGTHRLTADLCAQHARAAVDRPRLVREWLSQEGVERAAAGLAPLVSIASGERPSARPEPDLVLRVAADLASGPAIQIALSRALRGHGWEDELHPRILLVVGEAVANAIEHGSSADSSLMVAITLTPERADVQVCDEGRVGASMPLGPPDCPPTRQAHGRGRLVMERLADLVQVRSDGHGTRVLLQFIRPARGGSQSAAASE